MYKDSEEIYDSIFLSYKKILKKFDNENITTKNGKIITHKDLRQAINVMVKKHFLCRWKSEKVRSTKYYILVEGYAWLVEVYFQKEKSLIDADIEFFLDRILKYENLLEVKSNMDFCNKDMTIKEVSEYFNRGISSIRKSIRNMCNLWYNCYKYYNENEVVISAEGIKWLCINIYKQKYLELLEIYKMELTEKYIEIGYPYDHYLDKN